jgi:hypothetical protein
VPERYLPGNSLCFFDDFFELALGTMPAAPPPSDGSQLALLIHYLVAYCAVAGAFTLPEGFLNLIHDSADLMTANPGKDIFLSRDMPPPVAVAMKEAVTPQFDHPHKAFASLYLATQFEFDFRFLSGLLNSDGSWKSDADQQRAKLLMPNESRLNQRSISSVEVAYKLMLLNSSDPRVAVLRDLDSAIRSRFQSNLYNNLGGRIKYVRDRGAHGQWGDVSAEGVFYAALTAILYLASP